MKRADVLSTPYLAGRVARYHTWPTLHRQTVGEHTWNVLRIYWHLFGPLPPEVSTHIIWHDAGELRTGDPPFPVKAQNPDLKAVLDALEDEAVVAMGGPEHRSLPERERLRVKVCDLLEMTHFGLTEMQMGNTYARPIVDDTLAAVRALVPRLPDEDRARVEGYVSRVGGL